MIKERARFLDLLKGCSILMVIFTHYSWQEQQRQRMLFPFWIDMAVPIFMIISGYVYSMSYSHRGYSTFEQIYNFSDMWKKFLRYTTPFIIAFTIEEIAYSLYFKTFNVGRIISTFISGGLGPGSYYYPMMYQFIFIFPFVFILVSRFKEKGVFFSLIINALYELIKTSYGMPTETYRLIILRYIFLMSFGCYYYLFGKEKKQNKPMLFIMIVIGVLWEILVNYTSYTTIIVNNDWARTSFVCAFYVIPVFIFLRKIGSNWKFKPLEEIGKASYHIFLVQMVYYMCAASFVYSVVTMVFLRVIINIVVCSSVGYLFYVVEKPIGKWLEHKTTPLAKKILTAN